MAVAAPAPWMGQGTIRVGVACDYPPFGYTDIEGKNAGYDAEVARTLAGYAFGNASKVSFTCVTPQNRVPYLDTGKIDLIISTLGYTKERDQTIDYSTPYFTSGAKLLVTDCIADQRMARHRRKARHHQDWHHIEHLPDQLLPRLSAVAARFDK